jgi:hypothetical protein
LKKLLRILQYLDNQNISFSKFERDANLGSSYLTKTRDRGAEITNKVLEKIKAEAPGHYYKIFPEEKNNSAIDNKIEDPAADYSKKDPGADMTALLVKAMEMLSSNQQIITSSQKIIERQVETIQEQTALLKDQHGTIDKQTATIHQMVVNKKTKASA